MKIALVSDLHFEMRPQRVQLDRAVDVLVLAGDIDRWDHVYDTAQFIANGFARHIIHVAGNHEYYGARIDNQIESKGNFHHLNNSSVEIDGVTFGGGTLWTDYNLYGNAIMSKIHAADGLNDYRRIKMGAAEGYRKFRPHDALERHIVTRDYIFKNMPDVVVTHHSPSPLSIHPKYANDPLNPCYASDLTERIMFEGPSYWFHGHMHDTSDYMIGDTRVIANPYGYYGERENPSILYMEI